MISEENLSYDFEEDSEKKDFLGQQEEIKKVRIKDNAVKANLLRISPELFFGNCEFKEFDCIQERRNFIYVDGKRTNRMESISYICVTRNGNLTFKCLNCKTLFPEGFFDNDLEDSEESIKIRVPVAEAKITPYKIAYGMAFLTITVPWVKRV